LEKLLYLVWERSGLRSKENGKLKNVTKKKTVDVVVVGWRSSRKFTFIVGWKEKIF